MKIVTERDQIRTVADRWARQYSRYTGMYKDRFLQFDPATVLEKLKALDVETCTAADVAEITGNDSWTQLSCCECGRDVNWVLLVADRPERDAGPVSLCKECIAKAFAEANGLVIELRKGRPMKEHDVVRLTRDHGHVKAGAEGTVVSVHSPTEEEVDVEFDNGNVISVLSRWLVVIYPTQQILMSEAVARGNQVGVHAQVKPLLSDHLPEKGKQ